MIGFDRADLAEAIEEAVDPARTSLTEAAIGRAVAGFSRQLGRLLDNLPEDLTVADLREAMSGEPTENDCV